MATDPTQPIGKIKPQILSVTPARDTTLVNDTIVLVNDPVAASGGQTTQIPSLGTSSTDNAPKGFITIHR